MGLLMSDYQGFIPKMSKFTYLIFEYCFIYCLCMKIWKNHQLHEFWYSSAWKSENFPG